ncbi:MAG TPA: Smr/MutS family protein [Thermoanaerobaculia bacterium]|nr:Smr/MutS family protein [Thermoanaerobaculia bacterium]
MTEIASRLDALERAGGHGGPEDFRPILGVARAAEAVRRFLEPADGPALPARRDGLPQFDDLIEHGRRLFAADGSVRDDASPRLRELRERLRRRRVEVSQKMSKLLEERRDALGDAVLVQRNDRYCLPVLASARTRVPGIVHDRSGSGQTVFVEPLEVIEANNELALQAAEERREVERLLAELGRRILDQAQDLSRAVDSMGELDALETRVEFGEITSGRIPEISDDGSWTLRAARHPLLDGRLAPLRQRVLGESRTARDVVPLDLHLDRDKRLLVVSGPNAGGKTVVLKTAGLFSLLAQSGFPVPAAAGTRLPVFHSIQAEIGDAQAILADRSTFSSSMEILAEILAQARPGALALVDEIGGATDPEEGSALAVAWLEALLSRGARGIVTTHLSAVKNLAAGRSDAVCAAMEFDEATGAPNYRLHPGLSGRSHALSVARERRIPEPVLARAQEILGEGWRRRERAEAEAEAALERLRKRERELGQERDRAAAEAEHLRSERETLRRQREKILEEGAAAFDRAKTQLAREVAGELARLRQDTSRQAQASAARLISAAENQVAASETVLAEADALSRSRSEPLAVGSRARLRGTKTEGTVSALVDDSAWLEVSGKKMRVAREDLEPMPPAATSFPPPRAKHLPSAESEDRTSPSEVNVIGRRLEEAVEEVERALDAAILAGRASLRVVHGHGTGRLRNGLREHLRAHPVVASIRAADPREGGNGATIVLLK